MSHILFAEHASDAKFSECGKYRFWLKRSWNKDQPKLLLIGLNPSTADKDQDDPTIRRVKSLAASNGFGGIYMMNLFPFITPYPKELKPDNGKVENDYWLETVHENQCKTVCFCWGNFSFPERIYEMVERFPDALCFGKNKNGSPKHPLYLKADTKLVKY